MSDYIFLFDMDSTITRREVLPEVSKRIGKLDEMRRLTEATMRGEIPFRTSFLNRVKILSDISVNEVNQIVSEIPLNPYISDFIENTPYLPMTAFPLRLKEINTPKDYENAMKWFVAGMSEE